MKNRAFAAIFMALILSITGCAKKSDTTVNSANSQGTGFDTLSTADELSQLPQAAMPSQQASVEALPIETSPVTQGAPVALATTIPPTDISTASLSHDKKIQTALKNAGYYQGNIDGKIGPASKRAIETFQSEKGLKVDGKVGPKTWAALEPYLSGAETSPIENTAETTVQ